MNEPNDLVHFILGTKAETLSRIRPRIKHGVICDQFICDQLGWKRDKAGQLSAIGQKFGKEPLIVRSSSSQEDGWQTANAGAFKSILNVDGRDPIALKKAIDEVFASYHVCADDSQVLVQAFVTNTVISGVIFTCDLVTGAPYYVINYDDKSGSTESVTSGNHAHGDLRTVIINHVHKQAGKRIDARLSKVVKVAEELQNILGYDKLDIEFAMDQAGQVYVFQVRPIVVDHARYNLDDIKLNNYLAAARDNFRKQQAPAPHILGKTTMFSNMTDWNPAEIIGTRPNMLAASLYRYIITDEIWARQRAEFGYRDTRPATLVYSFCGQPYVDCRASLNSFVPDELKEDTAERIVTAYLNILRDAPHLHDKVELDVAFTIWVPTFKRDAKKRFEGQKVTAQDIDLLEASLKKLTVGALSRLDADLASLDELELRFKRVKNCDLPAIEKMCLLIEDCKRYGTLSFAHAARAGFVAVTFLKSLVTKGVLTKERMLAFQVSINTVAGSFQHDTSSPDMELKELIEKYGHLRPGTYDVNQKAYWENPDFYFGQRPSLEARHLPSCPPFEFSKIELAEMQKMLDELSAELSADKFVRYLASAIQAREESKFIFTRNISLALDLLVKFGAETLELTREEVGHLKWSDIEDLRVGQVDQDSIKSIVHLRARESQKQRFVKLPSFIKSEADFFAFEQGTSIPNFITQGSIVAEVACIEGESASNSQGMLDGKIILIPNADPGYDWLFAHNIAGLITKYGGANSHMAIRCAELGLPAAIGVGNKIYASISRRRIALDCLKGRIENV